MRGGKLPAGFASVLAGKLLDGRVAISNRVKSVEVGRVPLGHSGHDQVLKVLHDIFETLRCHGSVVGESRKQVLRLDIGQWWEIPNGLRVVRNEIDDFLATCAKILRVTHPPTISEKELGRV